MPEKTPGKGYGYWDGEIYVDSYGWRWETVLLPNNQFTAKCVGREAINQAKPARAKEGK